MEFPMQTLSDLAQVIDHTNLKTFSVYSDIKNLCDEALKWNFGAVCVNPNVVEYTSKYLKNRAYSGDIATVVGFPLGASTLETKAFETKNAIEKGATAIDMVLAVGILKSGEINLVKEEIKAVVETADLVPVKVIIETCYLTTEEKIIASKIAVEAGASYIKTSTGFGTAGATVEDVKLIRETIGNKAKIKAAGGIKSLDFLLKLVNAGADRIGASSSVKLMLEAQDSSYFSK